MADPAPIPNQQTGDTPAVPPRDMSQYIRTFAKDVAQITNQPAPVVPKSPVPTPADDVLLPEVDASPVNRPDGVAKDFAQEEVTLTKEDSTGIFAGPSSAVPAVSAPFIPAPPEPDEMQRREAVLARLRAKIASSQTPAQPTPTPVAAPIYTPPPTPPPYVPPYVPPVPQVPVPPPAASPVYVPPSFEPSAFSPFPPAPPQPTPVQPVVSPMPSLGVVPTDATTPAPLHTYTTDFADRIDRQQASTFSVLAAQSDSGFRTTTTISSSKRRGLIPIALAVLLILVGIGGLYAAYRFVSTGEKTEVTLGVPSLIFADEKMELLGPDYQQDLANAAAQPLVEGNILITYVTVASSTPLGLKSAPQPGGALIRLLNLGAPDILLRNVDVSSTVGVVAAGGQTSPFFILRVNSYERTFAGMLGWENRMLNDLYSFYPQYAASLPPPVTTATTTATSTMQVSSLIALPSAEGFTDAIVSNIDVRVLKDGTGRTLVLYGYSDKETLIIARDEAAFTTVVARLAATQGE